MHIINIVYKRVGNPTARQKAEFKVKYLRNYFIMNYEASNVNYFTNILYNLDRLRTN